MEHADVQSTDQNLPSSRLNVCNPSESLDSEAAELNRDADIGVGRKEEMNQSKNGTEKMSAMIASSDDNDRTSSPPASTSVISCQTHTEAPAGSLVLEEIEPSNEHNFTSEIYISPAPSICLWSPSAEPAENWNDQSGDFDGQFADTKAVLADRRNNFFSQVAHSPVVLPSSVSHSSILNFQSTANIIMDQAEQSQNEATHHTDATNGHTEIDLCDGIDINVTPAAAVEEVASEAIQVTNDVKMASSGASRERVLQVYQAAPPPDTARILPFQPPLASMVILEAEEFRPQYCARVEPSPERFWGPSVSPLRSNSNSLHCGDRTEFAGGMRQQGSSPGRLEALGNGQTIGGDAGHHSLSLMPFPQDSSPIKFSPREPTSSTSTDSLPSTPSSANVFSHQKGCNLEKLRTFFGENAPRTLESKSESLTSEPSPEVVVEAPISETRRVDLQKAPVMFDSGGKSSSSSSDRSFKNKKPGWSLSSKAHGTRSPGAKPKKAGDKGGDSADSSKQKEKESWKGKMARTILRYGSGPILSGLDVTAHAEPLAVIGVSLEMCAASPFSEFVPLLVSVCTRIVEEKGLKNQGIYRVPGNTGAINMLIEEMNKDPVGLCLENEKWQDVNLVSSLLKLFFRKLPDSLITDDLYESVIEANRLDDHTRRMLKLKKLLHELPDHNFETFHFLAQHLKRVASHEEINKMDARNLAIVFGPTLVRPQDDNMVSMVKDMTDQCRIIESIIQHCDWFFGSWDEDVNVPIDNESEELAPISGMNDELLAKAESLGKRSSLTF